MRDRILRRSIYAGGFILILGNVISDRLVGASWGHIAYEIPIIIFFVTIISLIVKKSLNSYRLDLENSKQDISRYRLEAEKWQQDAQDYLRGLADQIDKQFDRWHLTPSEKEVALLLIKGLSLREVAAVRDVTEKTIKQQSVAIYKKSGLKGRAELSAFFLEDLLLPTQTA